MRNISRIKGCLVGGSAGDALQFMVPGILKPGILKPRALKALSLWYLAL